MANYGYAYGNFTSQPQQYAAGTYVTQNAGGTYGYSTQPASRVVQGYQTAATAYGTAGYAQQQVPTATAPGGYGYFQRAATDPSAYAAAQKSATNYATTQGTYGYANSAVKPAGTYAVETAVYQKPQAYVAAAPAASSTFTGYSVQRPVSATPTYNNTPTYQKPKIRERPPPKTQQLHYCEVCKISCGGPQTYKEHLEGQKHKKKAASSTSDVKNLPSGTYKCELCDVICTGRDAFTAHVKGANHTKTIKLHQKLGKPIPEIKLPEESAAKKSNVTKTTAPRMNFVGGTKLTSTGTEESADSTADDDQEVPVEGEAIGEDYVEDVKSDVGKVIGFKCTLCDCRFNDVVAKNAHVKGKRHRLSYKKKVDPTLHVESKSRASSRDRRGSSGAGDGSRHEMVWKQRQQEQMRWEQELRLREEELRRWEHEEFMRRASEDRYWTRPDRHHMHELEYYEWERREKFVDPAQNMYGPPQGPPPPTPDDRLIMTKHGEVYPTEAELKQVQNIVATAEKALKLVSDTIGDEDQKAKEPEPLVKDEPKEMETAEVKTEEDITEKPAEKKPEPLIKDNTSRMLKGVMRVGALAKGLLLRGQLAVDLVVLCAERPTYTLLKRVGKLVPEKIKEAAPDEKYNMSISASECAIIITSTSEPKCTVKVVLTSPAMREGEDGKTVENGVKSEEPVEAKDVLDKEKSLQALAALRRAKWFQARANQLASCVITIRILRDICHRVPAFKPLNPWAVELLCEKALASNFQPLGPGEGFRRVLETIASGIFLPGGNGLLDPCEKDKTDASVGMSPQEKEDITAAAQQALRLHAFRQLHKILGIEPLKPHAAKPQGKRPAPEDATEESASKVAKKE